MKEITLTFVVQENLTPEQLAIRLAKSSHTPLKPGDQICDGFGDYILTVTKTARR